MCFSPEASFTSGGILVVVGAASLSKVSSNKQIVLASTPLIFAIQQLTEGVLWLTINQPENYVLQQVSTHIFTAFGQIFWPIWIPLSVLLIETEIERRKILWAFLGLGVIISGVLTYSSFIYPITPTLINHHIHYDFEYPNSTINTFSLSYLIPSVFSNLVSSYKKIQFLGLLTLLAFIISKIFFNYFVFSIWCFMSAIISIYILHVILSIKNPGENPGLE